ncbi:MAG: hypothetical protein KKA79_04215, partial [Nanoarchaeota archaeon]|nr:hypothetical protein [Nanoarchaeota archaeon]
IDTVQALKDFEIYKKVNEEKAVYRKQFIEVIKELNTTITDFRALLPHVHSPNIEKEPEYAPEPKAKVTMKKKPIKLKSRTNLDKLEDEAVSLRDKIAGL